MEIFFSLIPNSVKETRS